LEGNYSPASTSLEWRRVVATDVCKGSPSGCLCVSKALLFQNHVLSICLGTTQSQTHVYRPPCLELTSITINWTKFWTYQDHLVTVSL